MSTTTEETRARAAGEATRDAGEALAVRPERNRRKAALLAGGLAAGALLGYLLYEFFDPVNLFALRLQSTTVGTTNVTAL